jgi:hypothetical protein
MADVAVRGAELFSVKLPKASQHNSSLSKDGFDLTHLNPLTYVLYAIRTFILANRISATCVSGLSLGGLNLICRNAAQISNKS